VRRGESVIYITLAETRVELHAVAQSHGWSMDGIHVEDIIPNEDILHPDHQFTIFHPSEIEMGMTTKRILGAIEKYKPTRVVLDSLSELQLLAESPLRYRRQVLALKQYLSGKGCTTLFLDDRTALSGDLQVRSVAHGVDTLELINQDYSSERRRVRIVKYRGIAFRGGTHDYKFVTGGLVVYPRLIAAHSRVQVEHRQLSSGIAALDNLTGGGLDTGTSTLISGPPGTGKSSLCAQYVHAATQRGEKAAMFLFEEATNNLLLRSSGLGIDLQPALESGMLTIQQIDPAEMSPGEFILNLTPVETPAFRPERRESPA
jgi:circadian clock protein KaiC